jgi:hypothetical protein
MEASQSPSHTPSSLTGADDTNNTNSTFHVIPPPPPPPLPRSKRRCKQQQQQQHHPATPVVVAAAAPVVVAEGTIIEEISKPPQRHMIPPPPPPPLPRKRRYSKQQQQQQQQQKEEQQPTAPVVETTTTAGAAAAAAATVKGCEEESQPKQQRQQQQQQQPAQHQHDSSAAFLKRLSATFIKDRNKQQQQQQQQPRKKISAAAAPPPPPPLPRPATLGAVARSPAGAVVVSPESTAASPPLGIANPINSCIRWNYHRKNNNNIIISLHRGIDTSEEAATPASPRPPVRTDSQKSMAASLFSDRLDRMDRSDDDDDDNVTAAPSIPPFQLETDEMEQTEVTLTYLPTRKRSSNSNRGIMALDDEEGSDCIDMAFQQQPEDISDVDDDDGDDEVSFEPNTHDDPTLPQAGDSTTSSLSSSSSSSSASFSSIVDKQQQRQEQPQYGPRRRIRRPGSSSGAFPSLLSPQQHRSSLPPTSDEDADKDDEEEGCEIIFFSESKLNDDNNNNNANNDDDDGDDGKAVNLAAMNAWDATNEVPEVDDEGKNALNFPWQQQTQAQQQQQQQHATASSSPIKQRRTERVERGIFLSFQDMGFKTTTATEPPATIPPIARPATATRTASSPTTEGFFNRTSPVVVNDSRRVRSPQLQGPMTLKRIRTPIHSATAAAAANGLSFSSSPVGGGGGVKRSFATGGDTGGAGRGAGESLESSLDDNPEKDNRPVKEIKIPNPLIITPTAMTTDKSSSPPPPQQPVAAASSSVAASLSSRKIRVNHIRNAIFDSLLGGSSTTAAKTKTANSNNKHNKNGGSNGSNNNRFGAVWNHSSNCNNPRQSHHLAPPPPPPPPPPPLDSMHNSGMDVSALTTDSASRQRQYHHTHMGLNIFGPNPPSAAAIALGTHHHRDSDDYDRHHQHHSHHDHRRQPSTGDAQPIVATNTSFTASSSSRSLASEGGEDQSLTPSYRPSETNPVFGEEKKDDFDFLKGMHKILDLGYSHAVQKHKDWNLIGGPAATAAPVNQHDGNRHLHQPLGALPPPAVYTKNSDDPFDGLESTAASSNYTGLTTNTTSTAGDEESIGLNALSPREKLVYAQVRANSVATADFGRNNVSYGSGKSDEMLGPFRRVQSAGGVSGNAFVTTGGGSAFDQYPPIVSGGGGDESTDLSIEHRDPDEQVHNAGCGSAFVSPVSSSDIGRRSGFFDDDDDENNMNAALQRPSLEEPCWTAPVTMVSAVAQQQQGPCLHPYPVMDGDSYSDGKGGKLNQVLFTTTARTASPPSPISFDGYSGSIMNPASSGMSCNIPSPSLDSDSLVGSTVASGLYRNTPACHCFDAMPMLERGRWKSRRMKAVTADADTADDQSNSLLQGDMTRSDTCGGKNDLATACPTSVDDDSSSHNRNSKRQSKQKQQQQPGFNSFVNSFSEMARSTTDNIQNFWSRRQRTV